MFLRHRLMRPTDSAECFACSRDRHLYDEAERRDLERLWTELIEQGNALHSVIEEERPDGSRRVAYFCVCVPLTDAFVADAVSGTRPPAFSHSIFQAWQRGCSPILTVPQIAAANAGAGLKVMVMQSGWPQDVSEVEHRSIVEKIAQWIPYVNGGYRLTELLIESYSEWEFHWSSSAAFTLRIDYAQCGLELPQDRLDGLFGLSLEESWEKSGGPFSGLFKHAPPRFFFRAGERELLLQALSDETDADIAELLCISPATIKKRWACIFERVEEIAPELLPQGANDGTESRRGPEKRGRVLAYLRHHMEEVRPYAQKVARP